MLHLVILMKNLWTYVVTAVAIVLPLKVDCLSAWPLIVSSGSFSLTLNSHLLCINTCIFLIHIIGAAIVINILSRFVKPQNPMSQ